LEASAPAIRVRPGRLDDCSGQRVHQLSGYRNLVPTPTAIMRTNVQRAVGHYRSELPHCGDLETWLRFAVHGQIARTDAYQVAKRIHGRNMGHDYRSRWLLDIEQRALSITLFLKDNASRIEDAEGFRERTRSPLARMAVSCARSALMQAELAESERLVEYARRTYPNIVETPEWRRLGLLRLADAHLGPNAMDHRHVAEAGATLGIPS
jgi:hypothetical protein